MPELLEGSLGRGGSIRLLPVWAYAAIAAIPTTILLVFYARLDTLSRVELAIPAAFWTVAFAVIAWRRARHR